MTLSFLRISNRVSNLALATPRLLSARPLACLSRAVSTF